MKLFVIVVLTSLLQIVSGGRGRMKITKVMLADESDVLVSIGDGQLTNMDSSLHIWFV